MLKKIFFLMVFVSLASCKEEATSLNVLQGDAFGTTYTIQYYASETIELEQALDSVFYKVNKSVSTYMPQSDISKINAGDSTIQVDNIFKEVYRVSEIVYQTSEGYFDPTIGVLRNAYGFGDTKPIKEIDSTTLDSLRQIVGFSKVKLNSDGTITKENTNIYFDFNAIAKGYGIDLIGELLDKNNIENYVIELGGELLAKGKNLDKDAFWIAGIESPESDLENRKYTARISLQNSAMASSGNYRKFRMDTLSGKKYVHTINPLTGKAEQSDVTSATVIAKTCIEADAYATTFMAMGFEKSKALLEKLDGVEAYLTYNDSGNIPQVYSTEGMKEFLLD
ncbi:FAD:protein FMN transferase [Jejudonia soesokkakensis]|uniref:FAD:protein FMN transferase n=1 Tax=Jejudonia soesokkakensis TaxID=1323432 RepID=A0ABW2MVC0_9FLAO